MVVVHVLAYECVRLHRAVRVHLGHVHVVDEVDQPSAAGGPVVAPRFLLQGLFQYGCVGEEQTMQERQKNKNKKITRARTDGGAEKEPFSDAFQQRRVSIFGDV